ncbi:MAG: YfhO family protein, partial [Candidatus Roseilinea sp.]|uniref:YfhO family protein n=1 Tax=Candidatus Roseilinea sp. TaxID=2838777 RepID=UPI0040494578
RVVRGRASIDDDVGAFLTHLARSERDLRLAYSGDVKIYARVGPVMRAVVRDASGIVAGEAHIISDQPEHVVIDVRAQRAATLVLRDACYPGWVAEVNGQPSTIDCADILFRAVAVPAGESRVVMAYQPASVSLGLALSGAGVTVWSALAALALRRRARRYSAGQPAR